MSRFWDEKYAGDHFTYGVLPNQFLQSQADRLPAGGALLVPGDGEGRNGVWLAGRGFAVTSVDSSPVGQGKARRLAQERGVGIDFVQADLLSWQWPTAAFDGVVSIFFHLHSADRPRLHGAMLAALKPGGLLILEAFRPEQLSLASGGPAERDLLYRVEDLAGDFAAADIVVLEEAAPLLDEGKHRGPAATVRLVARKR